MAQRNTMAAEQVARIQDPVDTLGYGEDPGVATEEDEPELASDTV